jgi:cobalt/nickel transport system permease protein
VIAFPTLFNWVLPGDKLVAIWQGYMGYVHIQELYLTKQGLSVFTMLLLRTGCSVSIVMLLLLSTRWTSLLKAIRIVGVSQIFVMVLEMTYRYIFLLLQVVTDMFQAKKCRTVGNVSYREQRRFIGAAITTLLCKSLTLSQEVHMAMIARGYDGEPKSLGDFTCGIKEWRFIGAGILAIIGVTGGDIYLGR